MTATRAPEPGQGSVPETDATRLSDPGSEGAPARAWIALGSNLGDRRGNQARALEAIASIPGARVVAAAEPWETVPVGGPPGQGAFLNGAAAIETPRALDPRDLFLALKRIEAALGRETLERWGARVLDLDLLLHGPGLALRTTTGGLDLEIPHPRMNVRRFVLGPLASIAPEVVEPVTGRTIAELARRLDDTPRAAIAIAFDDATAARLRRELPPRLPAGWTVRVVRRLDGDPDPDAWRFVALVEDDHRGRTAPGSILDRLARLAETDRLGADPALLRTLPVIRPEAIDPIPELVAACLAGEPLVAIDSAAVRSRR